MKTPLHQLRQDYLLATFDTDDANASPLLQFSKWLQEALDAQLPEPNAMTLATCGSDGQPSARVVLLKGLNEEGLFFYTNYESKKGKQIAENPKVALTFCWLELQRQVRMEGIASKTSKEQSEQYFQSRPKESQISGYASRQSSRVESRDLLENAVAKTRLEFLEKEHLPLPEDWGGYCVMPQLWEFWQGRASRLHDRLQYSKNADGLWDIVRLAP